jgi:hypothetical protein
MKKVKVEKTFGERVMGRTCYDFSEAQTTKNPQGHSPLGAGFLNTPHQKSETQKSNTIGS